VLREPQSRSWMKWTVRAPQESRSNGLVEVYQPSECVTFHMKQDRLALLPPSVALRIKLPFAWLCFISSSSSSAKNPLQLLLGPEVNSLHVRLRPFYGGSSKRRRPAPPVAGSGAGAVMASSSNRNYGFRVGLNDRRFARFQGGSFRERRRISRSAVHAHYRC